jgi:membrane protease YdiL (CAAX protease family)
LDIKETVILTAIGILICCSLETIYILLPIPKLWKEEELTLRTIFRVIVWAPLREETIFRGPLYFFGSFHLLSWLAIIGTSLLFAYDHFGYSFRIKIPLRPLRRGKLVINVRLEDAEAEKKIRLSYGFTSLILALILGSLMVQTHNLLIPIIVHAGINSFDLLIGILSLGQAKEAEES